MARMQYNGKDEITTSSQIKSAKSDLIKKKKELKELAKEEEKYRKQGEQDKANRLKDQFETEKKNRIALEEELEALKSRAQEERNKKNKESIEKAYSEAGQKAADALMSGVSDIKNTLDTTMNSFIEQQESMAYGLTGTSKSLEDVTKEFTSTLGSTGVVKQQEVYSNLSELIKSGIVFNAEQRAYLATIAEDLGMTLNSTDGYLPRLINLLRTDLTDEKMAIQYSLKEFLNQNYQTSQYIVDSFEDVSAALLEAQALMTSAAAMQFESAVQQWLGSMSSVGASTEAINSLASAIGQLGSGNTDVLNSELFPLLAMGANNAGLDIGDILNNGLDSSAADALLKGIAQYAQSIYEGSGSNIVLSEWGKAFGIDNVSDLVALSQVGNVTGTTTLSTNIKDLLNNMDDYLYTTTKINNSLANFIYEWAIDTASDESNYLIYKVTDIISQATASLLGGVELSAGIPLLGEVNLNLGEIISNIPLLTTIPGLISSVSGLGKAFTSAGSASSIYDALANGVLAGSTQKIGVSGLFTGLSKKSGTSTSGSMVYFNSDSSDIGNTARLSSVEQAASLYSQEDNEKTTNDIYDIIGEVKDVLDSFKTTTFGTYTKIVESDNTVTIGNDVTFIQDMITFSAFNIQNIYALLVEYLKPENIDSQHVYDLDNVQWSSSFDWYSTASLDLNKK